MRDVARYSRLPLIYLHSPAVCLHAHIHTITVENQSLELICLCYACGVSAMPITTESILHYEMGLTNEHSER